MQRLYKKEKLCSTLAIEALFGRGAEVLSCLAYPLRAVWRSNPSRRSDTPIQFLISVPKRRLRHAVDRVQMRRRIREAYRLNHQEYALPNGVRLDVAFVYVAGTLEPYDKVERSIRKILTNISHSQEIKTSESLCNDTSNTSVSASAEA